MRCAADIGMTWFPQFFPLASAAGHSCLHPLCATSAAMHRAYDDSSVLSIATLLVYCDTHVMPCTCLGRCFMPINHSALLAHRIIVYIGAYCCMMLHALGMQHSCIKLWWVMSAVQPHFVKPSVAGSHL